MCTFTLLPPPDGGPHTVAPNARVYVAASVSFVNGINQTNRSTNHQRPCTTTQRIEKELRCLSVLTLYGPGESSRVESN